MIRLTPYAQRRLARREFAAEDLQRVLENPEQLIVIGERRIAQSKRSHPDGSETLMRVVFEARGEDVLVITMYETSKVAKYWRKQ